MLIIKDLTPSNKSTHFNIRTRRKIDTDSMAEFKITLSYEIWKNGFNNDGKNDVDKIVKVKGKVLPRTGHEGPEGEKTYTLP